MGDSKEPASAKIAPELSDTQRMMYAFGDSRRPKVGRTMIKMTTISLKMLENPIIRMKVLKKTKMIKYMYFVVKGGDG